MDGIHDLGGMQGLGAVDHSPAEPAFPERWQAVARALMAIVAGVVEASGGEFRHSIERMDPGHYLTSGYYEHWLTAAASLAAGHGLATGSELEARAGGRFALSGPVLAPPVADAGPGVGAPRFGAGDRARVRERHPPATLAVRDMFGARPGWWRVRVNQFRPGVLQRYCPQQA